MEIKEKTTPPNQKPTNQENEVKEPKDQEAEGKNQTGQRKKKEPVNIGVYTEYTELYFTQLGGGKLKPEFEKKLKRLEEEIKNCSGKIAKKTVKAAVKGNIYLFIKDLPVPNEIYKAIKLADEVDYYFK